ncbi:MAG: hypothetical protein QXE82_00240 [Candidatus Nitrosotenuis sp.]
MTAKLGKTSTDDQTRIKNKGGRPTKQRQIQIQNKLRPYFEAGFTEAYTALATKINKNTVSSYFREWTEEVIDHSDFVYQQQAAKARLTIELDRRINVYMQQIARLQNKLKVEQKPIWESLLTNANTALAKLSIDKAGILMTPTIDVKIKDILKERYGIDLDKIKDAR